MGGCYCCLAREAGAFNMKEGPVASCYTFQNSAQEAFRFRYSTYEILKLTDKNVPLEHINVINVFISVCPVPRYVT